MEHLKDTLLSSFIVFENELNGQKNTPFHRMRREALDVFEKSGFPTKRDEEWKYTNLRPVLKHDYRVFHPTEKSVDFNDVKRFFLTESDTYKIVFVDGYYASWLSKTTHKEYDICTFSAALNYHQEIVNQYAGKLINRENSLSALNTSFAREGAFVHIPDGKVVEKPIEILYLSTPCQKDMMHQPRSLIVLGKNARATVIERHQNLGDHHVFTNAAAEVYVHENAHLTYYKIQNDNATASLVDNTHVEQHAFSTATVNTFTLGGKFVRNNLNFELKGQGAEGNLYGITILNDEQFADHHTFVHHAVPHCNSNELYKGIYDGKSSGVFNGKILVAQDAQKTNAFQQNNNILLSDKASIDTKPQLEIFADDVKCSHGCTIGQLDEDALFYLRQRGIPEKEAKGLLMFAFANEALTKITIPELKHKLNRLLARKLHINLDFDL